ncbi:MAG: hypothetical protein ABIP33_11060 [Pseudolysinimonas sp.]
MRFRRLLCLALVVGLPAAIPAAQTLPASATNVAWHITKLHNGEIYAKSLSAGTVDAVLVMCSGSGYRIALGMPGHAPAGALRATFGSGAGSIKLTMESIDEHLWATDLRTPAMADMLVGDQAVVPITVDGRLAGSLSLAGSRRAINTALAACPPRQTGASPDAATTRRETPAPIKLPLKVGYWVANQELCSAPARVYRFDGARLWVRGSRDRAYVAWSFTAVRQDRPNTFRLVAARRSPGGDAGDKGMTIKILSDTRAVFTLVDEELVRWCSLSSLPQPYRQYDGSTVLDAIMRSVPPG